MEQTSFNIAILWCKGKQLELQLGHLGSTPGDFNYFFIFLYLYFIIFFLKKGIEEWGNEEERGEKSPKQRRVHIT